MDSYDILKHIPLFEGLPRNHVEALAGCAVQKHYSSGQTIFTDTQEHRALYFVVWGRVKIYKASPEGREQTIFLFGPGEPFCLTALSDEFSPASAMALEDTRILMFPAEILEDVARKEPSLLFNMLLVMSRRLKESLVLIESLSLKEIPERLAAFLVHSLKQKKEPDLYDPGFSHRELAKILGATPETLSRVLRKLAAEGVLSVEGRKIRVHDHAALEELTRGS
ncbi:MAG TPA: Crp/Fnr family transcriptional regulator [Deltaproteobacteria bacterium]|nr:Crp/Fnr family transcriptional regulator [Deltaproteobacteria bacterium]